MNISNISRYYEEVSREIYTKNGHYSLEFSSRKFIKICAIIIPKI